MGAIPEIRRQLELLSDAKGALGAWVGGVALAERGRRGGFSPDVTRGLAAVQAAATSLQAYLNRPEFKAALARPQAAPLVLTARLITAAAIARPSNELRSARQLTVADAWGDEPDAGTRPVGYAHAEYLARVIGGVRAREFADFQRLRQIRENLLAAAALGPFGVVLAAADLGLIPSSFGDLSEVLGLEDLRRQAADEIRAFWTRVGVGVGVVVGVATVGAIAWRRL